MECDGKLFGHCWVAVKLKPDCYLGHVDDGGYVLGRKIVGLVCLARSIAMNTGYRSREYYIENHDDSRLQENIVF